jgi:hypothetical protein
VDDWGIEELDLALQAERATLPDRWTVWGENARSGKADGRGVCFYSADYQFSALRKHPDRVVAFGASVAVEPNFSTWPGMPAWEALATIGEKRRMAARWQRQGVRILADLNVSVEFRHLALLGVPAGWRAYATRMHRGSLSAVEADLEQARGHAGTDAITFVLFGGGAAAESWAARSGVRWVKERNSRVRDERRAARASPSPSL